MKKYQPTLSLKPTQFSVGLLEIEYKVNELKKLRKKELARVIKKTPVPVVISPWKELCVIDHHHFLFACWHAGVAEVRVKVIRDFSKLKSMSYHQFWKKMLGLRYSYPYDQFGSGPRNPLYLPMDVRGMADDPYRSLAWIVRKEGGYENSDETFAEFKWANFFREKKLLDTQGRRGFHKAVGRALKLARSGAARDLPGFIRAGKTPLSKAKQKANEKKKEKKLKEKVIVKIQKSKFVPKAKTKGAMATVPKL